MTHYQADELTACGLFVAKLRTLGDHDVSDVPVTCGCPVRDADWRCADCEAALARPRDEAARLAGTA